MVNGYKHHTRNTLNYLSIVITTSENTSQDTSKDLQHRRSSCLPKLQLFVFRVKFMGIKSYAGQCHVKVRVM